MQSDILKYQLLTYALIFEISTYYFLNMDFPWFLKRSLTHVAFAIFLFSLSLRKCCFTTQQTTIISVSKERKVRMFIYINWTSMFHKKYSKYINKIIYKFTVRFIGHFEFSFYLNNTLKINYFYICSIQTICENIIYLFILITKLRFYLFVSPGWIQLSYGKIPVNNKRAFKSLYF